MRGPARGRGVRLTVDRDELRRYARRVGDRWPVERLYVGGHRVTGGAEGEDFVVVVVSKGFDGVPWLERVRQARALWDAAEMGGDADVHCYTPVELERKREALPAVRAAVEDGIEPGA
jgi:hypothetical protein